MSNTVSKFIRHQNSNYEKRHPIVTHPRAKDVFSLSVITATVLSIYYPILLGTRSLMTDINGWPPGPLFVGDPAAGGQITYFKQLAVEQAWAHLRLPIWLPSEGYGITLAGNQAAPWFAPEIILHTLFPGNLSIWNVVCLLLGAFGTYLLSRDLNFIRPGAVAAGLIYSLTGPAIANLNLDMINPLAIMPFLLLASKRLIDNRTTNHRILIPFLATSIATSQLFLSGFAEVIPLELATIGMFIIVYGWSINTNVKHLAASIFQWLVAVVIGITSSLIATITLLMPLKSYAVYQGQQAWASHQPRYWLLTLFDPWAFGKSVTAGPMDLNNTVWAAANPLIFAVVALALVLTLTSRPKRHNAWVILFLAISAFGVLGFSNEFHILTLLSLPPTNLILSIRFLPFLWWLPFSLLAGYGITKLITAHRFIIATSFTFPFLAMAVLVADLFIKGSTIFPLINRAHLTSTIFRSLPLLGLAAGAIILAVVTHAHQRARVVLLFLMAIIIMTVPKTFFSNRQAPSQVSSITTLLTSHSLGHSLSFSPANYTLPSALLGNNIPSIQAFDFFYPKGYAVTIAHYFGNENPTSSASPLFPGAPAMINVDISNKTIPSLRNIGVATLIVPYKLTTLAAEPSYLQINPHEYDLAMSTLLSIYLHRSDLAGAFPLDSSEIGLLNWAIDSTALGDTDATILKQYKSIFMSVREALVLHPDLKVFEFNGFGSTSAAPIKLIGKGHFLSYTEYVYDIAPSYNLGALWYPSTIHFNRGGNILKPTPLDISTANTPPNPALVNIKQGMFRTLLLNESESSDSLTVTLRSNQRGLVVVRSQISPGELAFLNGRPTPIVPIDNFLNGFVVPKGTSTINIRYDSGYLLALFWVNLGMNLFLVIMIIVLQVLRMRGRVRSTTLMLR